MLGGIVIGPRWMHCASHHDEVPPSVVLRGAVATPRSFVQAATTSKQHPNSSLHSVERKSVPR
jgi:hypothetical protein